MRLMVEFDYCTHTHTKYIEQRDQQTRHCECKVNAVGALSARLQLSLRLKQHKDKGGEKITV